MSTLSGQEQKQSDMKNFNQRVTTALIGLPIALLAAYLGGWPMMVFLGLIVALGTMEFCALAQGWEIQGSVMVAVPVTLAVVLAFHLGIPALWVAALALGAAVTFLLETIRHPRQIRRSLVQTGMTLAAVLYVGFPSAFLVAIRALPDGLTWLMVVLALTWGTDTFAYFGGRSFGRTPLAPALSPKKTREGAIAGMVGGALSALIFLVAGGKVSPAALAMLCIAPPVAVLGDLFESAIKRYFAVKDSHLDGLDIFPGHGGVLDRVDALVVVTTLCYLFIVIAGLAG
jgi:phosphatidate cytidylyltransferase